MVIIVIAILVVIGIITWGGAKRYRSRPSKTLAATSTSFAWQNLLI